MIETMLPHYFSCTTLSLLVNVLIKHLYDFSVSFLKYLVNSIIETILGFKIVYC